MVYDIGIGQCLTPILKLTPITVHRHSIKNDDGGDDDVDVDDDVDGSGDGGDDIVVLPVQRLVVELHSLIPVVVNFELVIAIEAEQRHIAH